MFSNHYSRPQENRSPSRGKLRALVLAAVVLLAAAAASLAVGTAAATVTPTAGNTLADKTFGASNSTEGLQVVAEGTNGTLNVAVYGINSSGSEIHIENSSLSAAAGSTSTYEYRDINSTKYPEYRVLVEGDGADSLTVAKLEQVTGGGGLLGSAAANPTLLLGAVAIGGLGWYYLRGQ